MKSESADGSLLLNSPFLFVYMVCITTALFKALLTKARLPIGCSFGLAVQIAERCCMLT